MRFFILLLASLPMAAGCGTVTNLQFPAKIDAPEGSSEICQPYGGVVLDARAGKQYLTDPISPAHGLTELCPLLVLYFWGIDLPLSMIGDTITFPIAVTRGAWPGLRYSETPAEPSESFVSLRQ
jgi:uncharacterized protein YceK